MTSEECTLCCGTGIGQFGDPDTSRCTRCHGFGECRNTDEDEMERADYELDCRKDEG